MDRRERSIARIIMVAWAVCSGQSIAAPVISNVAVSNITPTSATVTWITDVPATTRAYYEIGSGGDSFGFSTPFDPALATSHSATFTGLYPNQVYHYCLYSRDATNAIGGYPASGDVNFTTTAVDPASPYDVRVVLIGPHHVVAGHPIYLYFEIVRLGGSNWISGPLSVDTNTLPPFCTAAFLDGLNQPSLTNKVTAYPPGGTYSYATLQVMTAPKTPAGNYSLSLGFSAGGVVRTMAHTIIVDPVPAPLPYAAPATNPAIPSLPAWSGYMITAGTKWAHKYTEAGGDQGGTMFDYDAQRIFYQMADYTGDAGWKTYAGAQGGYAERVYRDEYVLPNNGRVTGYYCYSYGLFDDFWWTGDTVSREAALKLAQMSAYADYSGGVDFGLARETAFILEAYMVSENFGVSTGYRLQRAVDYALGHIDQQFVSNTAGYIKPFMAGLTMESLIRYYSVYRDPRIPPAIKAAADALYERAWIPAQGRFYYVSSAEGDTTQTQALDLLVAPAYAWLYAMTGDALYQQRADEIFSKSVDAASFPDQIMWMQKTFSQAYRWSFDFVQGRQHPDLGAKTGMVLQIR